MLFPRCSWFAPKTVAPAASVPSPRPRRSRPPLRLDQLEDRFAPAFGLLSLPIIIADLGPSTVPANLSTLTPGSTVTGDIGQAGQADQYALVLQGAGRLTIAAAPNGSRIAPRILLQQADGRVLLDTSQEITTVFLLQPPGTDTYVLTVEGGSGGAATGGYLLSANFKPLFPVASSLRSNRLDLLRSDADNHPLLAALASAEVNGSLFSNLGDGAVRSTLSGLLNNQPSLALAVEQRVGTTSMVLVQNAPGNRAINFSAGAFGIPSSGAVTSVTNRLPLSGDALGLSAFNPSVTMTPSKDRPIAFELSPYAPAGLDIVPVAVTGGVEEWFAELLGNPSLGTGPARSSAGPLGMSNDTTLRDAVYQMLQESWPPTGTGGAVSPNVPRPTESLLDPPPQQPPAAGSALPPNGAPPLKMSGGPNPALTDAVFTTAALTESEPDAETGKPSIEPAAKSMLAGFALGMAHAGWRERSWDERKVSRSL